MPKDPYDLPFLDKLNCNNCAVAQAALHAREGSHGSLNDCPEVMFWRGVMHAAYSKANPPAKVGSRVVSIREDGFMGDRPTNPALKEGQVYYVKRVWHRNGSWFFELDDNNREDGKPALYAAPAFTL